MIVTVTCPICNGVSCKFCNNGNLNLDAAIRMSSTDLISIIPLLISEISNNDYALSILTEAIMKKRATQLMEKLP